MQECEICVSRGTSQVSHDDCLLGSGVCFCVLYCVVFPLLVSYYSWSG